MFRGGFFPGEVVQTAAVSTVDIALWDLKGKALGVPVYDLLGGRARDRVVCYPHNGDRNWIEDLVEVRAMGDVRSQGHGTAGAFFRAVRFGIEQVKAVREALGNELEILVDVHTRLDPPASIAFCKGVELYRPFFIEDPLRSENPASLRLVRQQTPVQLAVGEQFASK